MATRPDTGMNDRCIVVRRLGLCDYLPTWQAMRRFTNERLPDTKDEVWLVQHPPVYTLGVAARTEHLLDPGDTPHANAQFLVFCAAVIGAVWR